MKTIEKKFLQIEDLFPFYGWLIPINKETEKKKFFKDNTYNPKFKYKWNEKKISKVAAILNSMQTPDSVIGKLYENLKQEYLKKIQLLTSVGKPAEFTEISKKIYGIYKNEDIEFAEHILATFSDEKFVETVNAKKIKKELNKKIIKKEIKGWKVELKKNIASKVTVKPRIRRVFIKSDYRFFPEEARRLKIHEISVHLFRAVNGELQGYNIFNTGLAGYLEAEEGLAVYFENIKGVCSPQQMKVYAGRLKAVEMAEKSSFRETFNKLKKRFPGNIAYRLCERAKRGHTDTSQPGSFFKDIHYITGYRKIRELLKNHDCLMELFSGKVGLDDIGAVRTLFSQEKLKKPVYVP